MIVGFLRRQLRAVTFYIAINVRLPVALGMGRATFIITGSKYLFDSVSKRRRSKYLYWHTDSKYLPTSACWQFWRLKYPLSRNFTVNILLLTEYD
jgi:hypothetical protein